MPLDIDRYAHAETAIHRWDPRWKIATLGVFAFGTALLQTLPLAFAALVLGAALVRLAALPLHFIAHGLQWVILFLLPFFLVLPFTYPGTPAMELFGLPFSWEGLRLAALIITKAVAIVLTTYAMFGSARFDVSMVALQRLKMPSVMVQMLLFTYRYTFVFLDELRRMETAMRARGFQKRTDRRTLKVVGNFVGTLLVRSFERTERVYKAMLSKGYDGTFHSMVEFHTGTNDVAKACAMAGLAAALIALDHWGLFSPALQGWY